MKHGRRRASLTSSLLCLLALLPLVAQATRLPSANRECATCHVMWLKEFKRKDVETLIPYDPQPRVETGRQDVVSTERMCFSCHDGFILDSRFLWKNRGHTHPVGVEPPQDMHIPTREGKTLFPLNKEGKIYCGTCHSAHGIDWKQTNTTIFLRLDNRESRLCLACHIDKAGGPKEGSHPLYKKPPVKTMRLQAAGSKFADDGSVICESCHRVHGSTTERLLVLDNRDSGLCAECHRDKAPVVGSRHDLRTSAPDATNRLGKTTRAKGPCSACHVPHNGASWRLWARKRGEWDKDPAADACLGCHNEQGPAHKKTPGRVSHPIGRSLEALGIQATASRWTDSLGRETPAPPMRPLPLFTESGHHAARGGRLSCPTCHDPHRWRPDGKTKADEGEKLEGDGNSSFLRIANGDDSALCVNCHRDKAMVVLSKHNLKVSAPGTGNVSGQDTRQSGVCSACHQPHNGTGIRLWARDLQDVPGRGLEPLCLSCHRKGGPAEDKTPGEHSHPLHLDPRRIKANTRLPLYDASGHPDDRRGTMDCATCHDPHQWRPGAPLDRTGVDAEIEGDAANSFLRLPAVRPPALCLDCHQDKRTLPGTEHDLFVTAPKARNALGQTVAESGECGACHRVHQAKLGLRLWAREIEDSAEPPASLCLGCHRKGGIAEAKVPEKWEHPPRPVTPLAGLLSVLPPVFDTEGRPAGTGHISCPSCHDPHRWQPGSDRPGPGRNLEGTVLTSFLRHASTEGFLCRFCHGEDSIYRYKYFHWAWSRTQHHLYKP